MRARRGAACDDSAGDRAGRGAARRGPRRGSASGEVIEGLARAAYLELDFSQAIEGWERAYARVPIRLGGRRLGGLQRLARARADAAGERGGVARGRMGGADQRDVRHRSAAQGAALSRVARGGAPVRRQRPGVRDARVPRGEHGPRRPYRGGHGAARRGARGGGGQRGRRLLRAGGDLLPALLGLRARVRRHPRGPVDPSRRDDRRAAEAPGGFGLLPHALWRRPDRGGPLAGGRRRADRSRPALAPRSVLGVAGGCPDPARRPARAARTLRGGRAAARRPRCR